jgi:hypothetical protein
MNPYLLLLLLPSVIVVMVMKYACHSTISWREMAVQAVVPLVLIAGVYQVSRYSMMSDTEILNGKVTGKAREWTSCSHSYQCRCENVTTGSGKNRHTTRRCDTCYEHSNDWNWAVSTTVGGFNVSRIDRRGSYEPPRWSVVAEGQPVAREHGYTNYVKAAPDSLFNVAKAKAYKGKLPAYPSVYDYQYADRVIAMPGVAVPDLAKWNSALSYALNDLGATKQANIVMVLTGDSPAFAEALRSNWLGGKKNDVLVVVGTAYPAIKWVRVYSWAKHDIINVALRNDLVESKTLDINRTVAIVANNISQHYERRPMADFEYLADEAVPPLWVMIFALVIGTGAAIWMGIYFHQNVCFEGSGIRRRRY